MDDFTQRSDDMLQAAAQHGLASRSTTQSETGLPLHILAAELGLATRGRRRAVCLQGERGQGEKGL